MTKDATQKGAIMLELLTVLMLLGALGPMLYRQVISRNEELDNINYATEIRALKEGFLAYIIANQDTLHSDCGTLSVSAFSNCTVNRNKLAQYMPDATMPDGFGFHLSAALQSDTSQTVVYQGFVYPTAEMLPADLTLRRAARIANLIGADGGVYDAEFDSDNIHGAMGSWETYIGDATDRIIPTGIDCTYLATTGLDTYSPKATVDANFSDTTYVPRNLAFERLHAWSSFSVGGAGEGNCYDGNREIGNEHTLAKCDPLFWVVEEESDGTAGNVHVKNKLHVGQKGGQTAVLLEGDSAGTDGKITIAASNNYDTLTIHKGVIETNRLTPERDGTTYKLDPSHTSVMNDIRLVSRGNAKLSALIPNYITMSVVPIEKQLTSSASSATETVTKPTCPENYVRAIIVTPTRWDSSATDASENPLGFSIEIDNDTSDFTTAGTAADTSIKVGKPKETSGETWTVKLGYKSANTVAGDTSFVAPSAATKVVALAQTFCVWDVTNSELMDKYQSNERPAAATTGE